MQWSRITRMALNLKIIFNLGCEFKIDHDY